jgi:hypothetical protein
MMVSNLRVFITARILSGSSKSCFDAIFIKVPGVSGEMTESLCVINIVDLQKASIGRLLKIKLELD